MKKRIIIVDCNAKIGGIQKALIALLKQIHVSYDITLLLLNKEGALLNEIPKDVRVISTKSDFRYMGMAQADCKTKSDKIRRGFYALISKFLGQEFAVRMASLSLYRDVQEEYDVAISYSHLSGRKSFLGGTAQYVLNAVRSKRKICYIHCDYLHSGNRSEYSDQLYSKFDAIVCVSKSTRERFIEAIPAMKESVYAVYNPIDGASILQQANSNTIQYNHDYINLLSVARLTKEKGIERIIEILGRINSPKFRYYVVGDGIERNSLEKRIKELHLEHIVTLCGEDSNPYRYMLDADLLVVPSYHEAAPVVFQEAKALNLPILTTRTTSADEMVGNTFGFVVDNDDAFLEDQLRNVLSQPSILKSKKAKITNWTSQVTSAQMKITSLIDE